MLDTVLLKKYVALYGHDKYHKSYILCEPKYELLCVGSQACNENGCIHILQKFY